MDDNQTDVTILTRAECLMLLAQASIGRIGASIGALPVILPVHFAVHEESVLFRTIPGTKLDAATIGAVVAFQADAYEPLDGTGWSVLLQGIASEVSDEEGNALARSVPIRSWVGMESNHRLVRIGVANVSGRQFRTAGEGPAVEFPDAPRLNESP
jgi:nitroimidazol reductase NimA-like FMN-containing flavoprotein (pyridoxamine 5'-phosphate oxidase superfamily)